MTTILPCTHCGKSTHNPAHYCATGMGVFWFENDTFKSVDLHAKCIKPYLAEHSDDLPAGAVAELLKSEPVSSRLQTWFEKEWGAAA